MKYKKKKKKKKKKPAGIKNSQTYGRIRFYERKNRRDLAFNIDILNTCTEILSAFLEKLQTLGPKQDVNIPIEFVNDGGNII